MKSFKLIAASLLAALSVSVASAVPSPAGITTGVSGNASVVHISGSTAFRTAVTTSIRNLPWVGGTVYFGGSTTAVSAGQGIYLGQLTGTSKLWTVIKVSWSGSEGGVHAVAGSPAGFADPTNPFINDTFVTTAGALDTVGVVITGAANINEVAAGDIALSDSFQAASQYKPSAGYLSLADTQIGIVPFVWVGAFGNDAVINNLTHQQIKNALLGRGLENQWTGTFNGTTDAFQVVVVGRNEDSGTRVSAFQESTFGAASSPTQYYPAGTAGAFTGLNPAPASLSLVGVIGHGGAASGGTLVGILDDASLTAFANVISYLGLSDAKTGLTAANPITVLPWEGVQYFAGLVAGVPTYNDALVFNGKYTFWGYEHLMTRSPAVADTAVVASAIVTRITGANTDASLSGYHLNVMNVKRDSDGGPVYNK
jgi:hypothetical protein